MVSQKIRNPKSKSDPPQVWVSLILFLFTLSVSASAATLAAAEYFWDTDPGAGNGTQFTAPAGVIAYDVRTIPTSSLSTGMHTLYIRYRDSQARWSEAEGRRVYITPPLGPTARNIGYTEYFWDTDPGQGNATTLAFPATTTPYLVRSLNTSSLSVGAHVLEVRYLDNSGKWGSAEGRRVYITPPIGPTTRTIAFAEYFWDTDPGPGNATTLAFPATATPYLARNLGTNLSPGAHVLKLRYRDNSGIWGSAEGRRVYITPPLGPTVRNIAFAEYFWDTDPGPGNATTLAFPATATPYLVRNPGANLSSGAHVLKIRYRDNSGKWGSAEGRSVYITPPLGAAPTIAQARVYFDTWPQPPASGTFLLPDDGTFDEPQEDAHRLLAAANFTAGEHYAFTRVQDSRGFWSPARKDTFVIAPFDFRLVARPNANADSVRLNWASYPVTDHYQVHTDSLATGPFTSFFTVPGTDSSVVVPTVSPPPQNPKRFFQVNAVLPDTAMFRSGDPLPPEYTPVK